MIVGSSTKNTASVCIGAKNATTSAVGTSTKKSKKQVGREREERSLKVKNNKTAKKKEEGLPKWQVMITIKSNWCD